MNYLNIWMEDCEMKITLTIEVEVSPRCLFEMNHYSHRGQPCGLPSRKEMVELFWKQLEIEQPAFWADYELIHKTHKALLNRGGLPPGANREEMLESNYQIFCRWCGEQENYQRCHACDHIRREYQIFRY